MVRMVVSSLLSILVVGAMAHEKDPELQAAQEAVPTFAERRFASASEYIRQHVVVHTEKQMGVEARQVPKAIWRAIGELLVPELAEKIESFDFELYADASQRWRLDILGASYLPRGHRPKPLRELYLTSYQIHFLLQEEPRPPELSVQLITEQASGAWFVEGRARLGLLGVDDNEAHMQQARILLRALFRLDPALHPEFLPDEVQRVVERRAYAESMITELKVLTVPRGLSVLTEPSGSSVPPDPSAAPQVAREALAGEMDPPVGSKSASQGEDSPPLARDSDRDFEERVANPHQTKMEGSASSIPGAGLSLNERRQILRDLVANPHWRPSPSLRKFIRLIVSPHRSAPWQAHAQNFAQSGGRMESPDEAQGGWLLALAEGLLLRAERRGGRLDPGPYALRERLVKGLHENFWTPLGADWQRRFAGVMGQMTGDLARDEERDPRGLKKTVAGTGDGASSSAGQKNCRSVF